MPSKQQISVFGSFGCPPLHVYAAVGGGESRTGEPSWGNTIGFRAYVSILVRALVVDRSGGCSRLVVVPLGV